MEIRKKGMVKLFSEPLEISLREKVKKIPQSIVVKLFSVTLEISKNKGNKGVISKHYICLGF